ATCAASWRPPRPRRRLPGSPARRPRRSAASTRPSPRRAAPRPTLTRRRSTASHARASTSAARAVSGGSGRTPRRSRAGCRALQRIDFQIGRLLRLVAELRLHRAFGFPSLPDYVRERLGCSPRKTRALVALDRRLAGLPTLAADYRDGRLSFARALVLLPVINAENEVAWVARAQEVTIRRLGDLVDWALEAG